VSSLTVPKGTTDRVLSRMFPEDNPYLADPVAWVRERLKEHPWSMQREIIEDVRDERYVAVQSAHDTGKSWIASRAASWWIDAHPPGEAFVVSTAPSQTQVEAILWREVGKAHRKGDLVGRITSGMVPQWKIGAEIVGFGRKPQDLTSTEEAMAAFQGIHARYVLVVIDEAGGVPKWLFDAVDSLVTNEDSRVLAIGNPDDPSSHFETICRPGSGWKHHKVSAFDTPAFTGEKVPEELLQVLVSKMWVDERKKRWGETSPLYVSKVNGDFPEVTDDTLITPAMIRDAQERHLPGLEHGRYGLDIAEYGSDRTTLYRNRGGKIRKIDEWHKQGTMETVGKVKIHLDKHKGHVPVVGDSVGVGSGACDRLSEMGYKVLRFNGGERALNPKKFVNRRSEAYWEMREMMEDGAIDLDPADEDLASQLGSIKYSVDSAGRVKLEKKDDMKKRGLPSPDYADGAMQSCVAGPVIDVPVGDARRETITGDLLKREM
jgi:hypothetical protein